jgi:hypothetical protein
MVELKTNAEIAAAGTASAAPCTRIRTCPTRAARARACGCGRVWSSRSSRCPPQAGGAPQIATRTDDYRHDPDGWTLRTASGARAAHSEHTVAVTADGPRVLTC